MVEFTDKEKEVLEGMKGHYTLKEMANEIKWNANTFSNCFRRTYGTVPKRERVCINCGAKFKTRYKQTCCSKRCRTKVDSKLALSKRDNPESKYKTYGYGARSRGLSFDLTFEEFSEYWQQPCTYCGDDVATIGLDRVDSSRGYSVDNVVPCCTTCNIMKSNLSVGHFLNHISKINGRRV